ncbi:MAG: HAD-IC family P-type ATPase [Proteobacteria bacterium]|nr:HAD-IC family P-type ATPase [Pseudomonadota bacterium]
MPRLSKDLTIGDELNIDSGLMVPADGTVLWGIAEVSESSFTGESRGVTKVTGDMVFGGTYNIGPPFGLKVTATGSDTWLEHLHGLIEEATQSQGRFDKMAGLVARSFVGATILFSLLGALVWWDQGPRVVLEVVWAVLIVSCPCALAMAIPLANALAVRRCWQAGIIVRNVDVFANARSIDTIVFDKTGTLTSGEIVVTGVREARSLEGVPVGCLQSLTRWSLHPVARAVYRWAQLFPIQEFNLEKTRGFVGLGTLYEGSLVRSHRSCPAEVFIGSVQWVIDQAQTEFIKGRIAEMALEVDKAQLCAILFRVFDGVEVAEEAVLLILKDEVRADTQEVLDLIRKRGLSARLLTGDRRGPALELGRILGFCEGEILFEHSPEQKLEYVRELASQGRRVMMVGDGVNDAAVLRLARIGVAVHGGSDLALQSADVFFSRRDLKGLMSILDYSDYHMKSLGFIMGFSLLYNLAAITLALLNLIHPLTAALIMPLASLTVIIIAWIRKGSALWKSSMLSCPLP